MFDPKAMIAGLMTVLGFFVGRCVGNGECVQGWYVNGVRPTGVYECRPVLGDPERDLDDAHARLELHDERATTGAIYCTGGAHPIVTGERTVGCQR